MKKNVAGQIVTAMIIAKADGTPVTTGTTYVYITGDGVEQTLGATSPSEAVHRGNGLWVYSPLQSETNYDHIDFTFVNTNGVNANVQIYTSYPQTGDNYPRLGAPTNASIAADIAAIFARVGAATGSPSAQTISDDLVDIKSKVDAYLDAAISSRLASGSYSAPPSAATIAAAVFDLDLSTHTTAGTAGYYIAGAATYASSAYTDTQTLVGRLTSMRAGNLDNLDAAITAIKAKTDNLPSSPAATSDVTGLLTSTLTEAYAADGSQFTLSQALYMIWSLLAERSIVSTTLTAKKLDGSTAAMTFTLDSATTPTSQTRAT